MLVAKIGLSDTVDLGNRELLLLESSSSLLVLGSQGLAVATPIAGSVSNQTACNVLNDD